MVFVCKVTNLLNQTSKGGLVCIVYSWMYNPNNRIAAKNISNCNRFSRHINTSRVKNSAPGRMKGSVVLMTILLIATAILIRNISGELCIELEPNFLDIIVRQRYASSNCLLRVCIHQQKENALRCQDFTSYEVILIHLRNTGYVNQVLALHLWSFMSKYISA